MGSLSTIYNSSEDKSFIVDKVLFETIILMVATRAKLSLPYSVKCNGNWRKDELWLIQHKLAHPNHTHASDERTSNQLHVDAFH